jgi:hypothetical protein
MEISLVAPCMMPSKVVYILGDREELPMTDTDDKWIPKGVIDALNAEENELRAQLREVEARLNVLGEIRQRITGIEVRPRIAISTGGNTRLAQIVSVLDASDAPLKIKQIYAKLQEADPSLNWHNPAPVFRSYIQRQPKDSPDKIFLTAPGTGLYGLRRKHKPSAPPEHPSPPTAEQISVSRKPMRRGIVLDEAEAILREARGPLPVGEILVKLQERGVHQRAFHPKESLKVNLRHNARFVHVGAGEFDLRDRHNGNELKDA